MTWAFSENGAEMLSFRNPRLTALSPFAHDGPAWSRRLTESRFRGPRGLWQFAIIWGISVELAAFAVLTVLSSSAVCSNVSYDRHLRSLDDYLAGGILEDPLLGLTLREDRRDLKSGASAMGLLIIDINKGSPAANAGLAALRTTPKEILSGIVVVGSMAFPPAILLSFLLPIR